MTDDTPNSVGVDISKAHLDAYMVPAGKAARFSNDAAGLKALIAWVERPVRTVTYEPTGRWHRAFEEALFQAELPLARVNPLQARRFAQAIGQRAKTDAVDARMLAQMGAALDLRRTEASSPARRALEELQVARDALVKDRTAAMNRQKQLQHRLLRRQNTNRLSQIDRQLTAIDTEIEKCCAEDVVLTRRTEILTSIPGVFRVTAAGLLTQIPELGSLDAKAVASLAGLAPVTRQSGTWAGRSFIQGGRARARRLLYMPALAATCHNPELRAKYRELVAQGKPRKVAEVAVMRKLLVLANALLGQDRCWQQDRPGRASAATPSASMPFVQAWPVPVGVSGSSAVRPSSQRVRGHAWASSAKSRSGACAEPASRPQPRGGGGAKRRALTAASTRRHCWSDDAPAATIGAVDVSPECGGRDDRSCDAHRVYEPPRFGGLTHGYFAPPPLRGADGLDDGCAHGPGRPCPTARERSDRKAQNLMC